VAEMLRERGLAGHLTGAGYSFQDGLGQSAMKGVNDGNGFAFVDHVGNVCPSGFLQLPAGNLRKQSFIDIYRHSALFRQLRDYTQLSGRTPTTCLWRHGGREQMLARQRRVSSGAIH